MLKYNWSFTISPLAPGGPGGPGGPAYPWRKKKWRLVLVCYNGGRYRRSDSSGDFGGD